ncbi:MAG: precorrin-6A reductase [Eubacterium sp.]|nr:precorrin-6A reductase [Eubacterium sp.]
MRLLIFGGTTEGRLLSERLGNNKKINDEIIVSVASDYGMEMLHGLPGIKVHVGRMDKKEMESFLREGVFDMVIDATHPFATEVTDNIKTACSKTGIRYIRLKRGEESGDDLKYERIIFCKSCEEAAEKLMIIKEGNVLLTTGSKELECFTKRIAPERLFVRIIPTESSIDKCLLDGIEQEHIIALKGPFSEEINVKHIREHNISYLVTKESGTGSGYLDKIKASEKTGITVFVIKRPDDQGGSMEEVLKDIYMIP